MAQSTHTLTIKEYLQRACVRRRLAIARADTVYYFSLQERAPGNAEYFDGKRELAFAG